MLPRLIEFSLNNRLLVILLFTIASAAGVYRLVQLPIDAFPDTTPVQVQINTVAPALSPEEIEQQITLPVELSIGGLPGLENVRSVSKFGFSQVVATFSDDTRIIDARQYVSERLGTVELPEGVRSWGRSPPVWAKSSITPSAPPIPIERSKSYERSTIGSSSPSCGKCPASPRSTHGAARSGNTTSWSIRKRSLSTASRWIG